MWCGGRGGAQIGVMHPECQPTGALYAGQVGYIITGMKSTREARVGDTLHLTACVLQPPPSGLGLGLGLGLGWATRCTSPRAFSNLPSPPLHARVRVKAKVRVQRARELCALRPTRVGPSGVAPCAKREKGLCWLGWPQWVWVYTRVRSHAATEER
jgi:hypothetical protein